MEICIKRLLRSFNLGENVHKCRYSKIIRSEVTLIWWQPCLSTQSIIFKISDNSSENIPLGLKIYYKVKEIKFCFLLFALVKTRGQFWQFFSTVCLPTWEYSLVSSHWQLLNIPKYPDLFHTLTQNLQNVGYLLRVSLAYTKR